MGPTQESAELESEELCEPKAEPPNTCSQSGCRGEKGSASVGTQRTPAHPQVPLQITSLGLNRSRAYREEAACHPLAHLQGRQAHHLPGLSA